MNYARYSKQALDALPPRSLELRRRIVELTVDVKLELHATVASKLREIVETLNSLGHDLHETSRSKAGEIDFAQGERPNPFYVCCDTTISAGYSGTYLCDAAPEEEGQWAKEWTRNEQWAREWASLQETGAEPSAAPNGGPASPVGNSNVTEGPPSVS